METLVIFKVRCVVFAADAMPRRLIVLDRQREWIIVVIHVVIPRLFPRFPKLAKRMERAGVVCPAVAAPRRLTVLDRRREWIIAVTHAVILRLFVRLPKLANRMERVLWYAVLVIRREERSFAE